MTDVKLDKDEKRFARDLSACTGIAREVFPFPGIDHAKAAVALYEILGPPGELKPAEKEETMRNLAAAAAIAQEAFGGAPSLDTILDIYEMEFAEEEDEPLSDRLQDLADKFCRDVCREAARGEKE